MVTRVDLSQALFDYPLEKYPFSLPSIKEIYKVGRDPLNMQVISSPTHYGTHVDAPRHFIPGGKTIDEMPLEKFIGDGVIITVEKEKGQEILLSDIAGHEIKENDIVFINTGWYKKYNTPEYGQHPYLSLEVARFLIESRIKMVGVDCITVDLPLVYRAEGWQKEGFDFPICWGMKF